MKRLGMVVFLIVSVLYSTGVYPAERQSGKWWNEDWHYRSMVSEETKPTVADIYAVKADFTTLLKNVTPAGENMLDVNSIRVIAYKNGDVLAECESNFIPDPDFNALRGAKGTVVWRQYMKVEDYWIYFDRTESGTKPVVEKGTGIDINLIAGGSFDKELGSFKAASGDSGFDESKGYFKDGSVRIKKGGKGDGRGILNTPLFAVEPGKSYTFLFYASSDAKEGNRFALLAYLYYYDEDGKYIDRSSFRLDNRGTFAWRPYTGEGSPPEGAKKCLLTIQTYQDTGSVWIDDIRIHKEIEDFLDNSQYKGGSFMKVGSVEELQSNWIEIRDSEVDTQDPEKDGIEKRMGFYLWESNPAKIVYYYSRAPVARKKEIRVWGTPGETVSANLCIRPFVEVGELKISIEGDNLKDIVRIRQVKHLKKRTGGDTYQVLPIYLDAVDGHLEKGMTSQYFLTSKIPESMKAGIYKGSVVVTSNNSSYKVPVYLRVLPFKLEEPPDNAWGMFYANHDWNGIYKLTGSERVFYPEKEPEMFKNMREHNCNSIAIMGGQPYISQVDGKYLFDYTRTTGRWMSSLIDSMNNATKSGFKTVLLMSYPAYLYNEAFSKKYLGVPIMSEEWKRLMVESVVDVKKEIKKNGWPQRTLFYAIDEPANGKKLTEDCITMCKIVKENVKDVQMAETLHRQTYEQISPFVDVSILFAGHVDTEILKYFKENNTEYWLYNGGSFGRFYKKDRMLNGFYLYRIGATGNLQWAYVWPQGPYPYDDTKDTKRGRGSGYYYIYPSEEGLKDTLAWEGFRDGVTDYKYIYTLKKIVDGISASGDEKKKKEAVSAWLEIETLVNSLPVEWGATGIINWLFTGNFQSDMMDAWRWKVAEKIMLLKN
jgi:hypothetical protein